MINRFRRIAEPLLLRMPTGLASRLRIAVYRALGMKIGRSCRFEQIRIRRALQIEVGASNAVTKGCWFWPIDSHYDGIRIEIGDSNYFNRDVMIDACNFIRIGSHNMFGPGVYVTDSNHRISESQWVSESGMDLGTVTIGDGCWIGANAVILKGVTLGDRCVVAAGSVVTGSFPAGSLVAGAPARLLNSRET